MSYIFRIAYGGDKIGVNFTATPGAGDARRKNSSCESVKSLRQIRLVEEHGLRVSPTTDTGYMGARPKYFQPLWQSRINEIISPRKDNANKSSLSNSEVARKYPSCKSSEIISPRLENCKQSSLTLIDVAPKYPSCRPSAERADNGPLPCSPLSSTGSQQPPMLYTELQAEHVRKVARDNGDEVTLGRGTYSDVFEGKLTLTGETVAMKKLLDDDCLEDAELEANILCRLESTGFVPKCHGLVKPCHETGNCVIIVQEKIENGRSLEKLIDEKALTERQSFEVAVQLASAMASFTNKQVLHNDMKPDNVLITFDQRNERNGFSLKVIDFGLASYMGGIKLYAPNNQFDHMAHMAPEAKLGGKTSVASDVYSYGYVLFLLKCPLLRRLAGLCMKQAPSLRPTWSEIKRVLADMMKDY